MAIISDRRKHPRYPINVPVFIFYPEKRAVAHTLDMGLGGMKIYTDKVFPSRRDFLFQIVLQRKTIWVKGRFVFEQTQPELMNFSCIKFEETAQECIHNLKEFLSHQQHLLKKECLDMEVRIREREAALAKANELLKVEIERRKREGQVIKEVGERLGYLSSVFSDDREKRIRMTVQGLDDRIEALLVAITNGLNNIHLLFKEGKVADQIAFEQIIFSIQNNYKEIRRVLENLGPSILDELGLLGSIGYQCQELQNIYYGIQNEKEEDVLEDSGFGEIQFVQGRKDS
ncbi:MAG: PilZ domain-containing protein [Candidatus Aquicultor sp.]